MQLLDTKLKNIEVANDIGDTVCHVMEPDMINAVNAALAINRPLLIWGEPGIGKSQLAKAVAKKLKRPFLHFVADARTEARDLLWHFDAVARLAEAQLKREPGKDGKDPLAVENFIVPGPMWWALNWNSAKAMASQCKRKEPELNGGTIGNGVVVLIDEIDKADTDVPNGLLEALGSSRFHPQGLDEPVVCTGEKPLVIITTNEERSLPDAFLRRCLSLHLHFPESRDEQKAFLVKRAEQNAKHFPLLDSKVFAEAADMLVDDREYAKGGNLYPLPGQAEYFDMLRGIQRLSESTGKGAADYINDLRKFTYQKHSGFHAQSV